MGWAKATPKKKAGWNPIKDDPRIKYIRKPFGKPKKKK